MRLASRTVWITGASSGIGKALAGECARRGARLILSARRGDALESVRSSLSRPEDHACVPLDLADPASLEAAYGIVSRDVGAVDVLVNNGGISQRSLAAETDMDVDRRLMEVNYFGAIGLTKRVLPDMLERGNGQLVAVSSLVGKFGTPYRSGYAASKHALHGFFDSLRAEVAPRGLTVTLICPGFVKTQVSVNALTSDGSALGEMDDAQAGGLSAEACAVSSADAIEADKPEVYIAGKELAGVYVSRFAPWLFRRLIQRAKVR
ncbi:MAG: SDR family oxidoreductase [Bacteroidota bacterium]